MDRVSSPQRVLPPPPRPIQKGYHVMTMPWRYNDGGRAITGIRGGRDDCVCRAIAIATGKPYREVFDLIVGYAADERPTKRQRRPSDPLNGVHAPLVRRMLSDLGWHWFPLMGVGTGTVFHLRPDELPGGTVIAKCSGHIVTDVDGVAQDTYDPSRRGSRCVYGIWLPPKPPGDAAIEQRDRRSSVHGGR